MSKIKYKYRKRKIINYKNGMYVNIEKCKCMYFHLTKKLNNYNYFISNSHIELLSNFKDLDIIFGLK